MQIIFGPVNSRRFGSSLGVDLSPQTKQCNFDCLYCELAPAAPVAKQNYVVSVDEVLDALKEHLDEKIDVITITANGEPTLYPHLDELVERIDAVKGKTKTLILTNAATLSDENVYKTLLKFDKVKLSLDSVTPQTFKKIDRPQKHIHIEDIIDAVQRFSKEYKGELYIEILFVKGINDSDEEIAKLNEVLLGLENVTRVDIGTIDRPPAYPVEPLSYEELHTIAKKFDASLLIHIASRKHTEQIVPLSYSKEEICNTLDKRPLTMEDIEILFDKESQKRLQELIQEGQITTKNVGSLEFFLPSKNFLRKRAKSS